ncbi:MAG: type II toxin-antitoxin system VapC family toxin [Vicinamibacterales bacterium]
MTIVVDASLVVAALVDSGTAGTQAAQLLAESRLVAPHLMPVEVANILRRAVLAGSLGADVAALAHADLLDLGVVLYPYEPFADRCWALHPNVTAYDAWYVAMAESLSAPLATLDGRLTRAPGVQCEFLLTGS